MIDSTWAHEFAREWIAAWNSHDLELILSHYADDFEMASLSPHRPRTEALRRILLGA